MQVNYSLPKRKNLLPWDIQCYICYLYFFMTIRLQRHPHLQVRPLNSKFSGKRAIAQSRYQTEALYSPSSSFLSLCHLSKTHDLRKKALCNLIPSHKFPNFFEAAQPPSSLVEPWRVQTIDCPLISSFSSSSLSTSSYMLSLVRIVINLGGVNVCLA